MNNELVTHTNPKSMISESIKTIRANLLFASIDKTVQTILVTSANPGEGKSFISSNLSITFAQTDKKVLLIDSDMRKGRIKQIFKIHNLIGLSDLLITDKQDIKNFIHKTEIDNLDALSMGTIPPNPSELLGSVSFKKLLNRLKEEYDIIIIDSPPVNRVSDSLVIANLVDTILLVTKHNATKKSELAEAVKNIKNVNGKLAGIIINQKKLKKKEYYGKYYQY